MEFNHDVYILRGKDPLVGMWECGYPLRANEISLPQQLAVTIEEWGFSCRNYVRLELGHDTVVAPMPWEQQPLHLRLDYGQTHKKTLIPESGIWQEPVAGQVTSHRGEPTNVQLLNRLSSELTLNDFSLSQIIASPNSSEKLCFVVESRYHRASQSLTESGFKGKKMLEFSSKGTVTLYCLLARPGIIMQEGEESLALLCMMKQGLYV